MITTRLADEQRELKGYESAGCNEDPLDSEEKVRRDYLSYRIGL